MIINNDFPEISDSMVLSMVLGIVNQGKISGTSPYEQYSYASIFIIDSKNYAISCRLNRKSGTSTFDVLEEKSLNSFGRRNK